MAKKSICARAKKKEALCDQYRERRMELKKLIKSSIGLDEVMEAQAKLAKLPVNSSAVRVSSRCWQCKRPRAVYRKFGLCRICLRQQLMAGNITGGRKSSW